MADGNQSVSLLFILFLEFSPTNLPTSLVLLNKFFNDNWDEPLSLALELFEKFVLLKNSFDPNYSHWIDDYIESPLDYDPEIVWDQESRDWIHRTYTQVDTPSL